MRLSRHEQQVALTIAREKGIRCECGSAEFQPPDEASTVLGGAEATLQCKQCGRPVELALSAEEGERLGLDMNAYGPEETF
jgi:DNA-directed RNA polymerase subunit RPC12/RpoP